MKKNCSRYCCWALLSGLVLSAVHLLWLLCIAVSQKGAQWFLDWIMDLHHLQMSTIVLPFNLGKAVILVVLTFVVGYALGWLIAGVHYCLKKV